MKQKWVKLSCRWKSPLFKTWFVTIYISLNADIYVHMALKTIVSNISHSHQTLINTPYFMWVPLSNIHKKPEQSESWLLFWLYWPLRVFLISVEKLCAGPSFLAPSCVSCPETDQAVRDHSCQKSAETRAGDWCNCQLPLHPLNLKQCPGLGLGLGKYSPRSWWGFYVIYFKKSAYFLIFT